MNFSYDASIPGLWRSYQMRDVASNRLNRCKNTDSFNTCDMLKRLAGPRNFFFCLSHVLFPILPATMIPTDSYLLGVFQSPSGKTSVTSPEYHNLCCHPIGAAEAMSDKPFLKPKECSVYAISIWVWINTY